MPTNHARLTRLFALLAAGLALLAPAAALAQEAPNSLRSLTIELWPEFDRPGVLVIYNGVLATPAGPDAPVSLLLPPDATVNAVAAQDAESGGLVNAEHETQTVGNRTQITLTSETDNFWVEFYAPANTITQDGDTRSFTHTWDGDLAVEQLIWHVQQPATASDLTVSPEGGQVSTDTLGLPDYTIAVGAVAAGETATASVSYTKTDDVLTSSMVEPAAEESLPAQESAPASSAPMGSLLPIGLAVLGVALLAGGVFFYWRSGRSPQAAAPGAPARSKPSGKVSRAERAAQQRQAAAGFCTNCGNPLQPNDKFCRECGTPVTR